MEEEPFVSIIIPFFNRQHKVVRAVNSVLKQSYSNYEIILVNDGSTENISKIIFLIDNQKNIKFINQTNLGPAAARNKGISQAVGEYIAFLDSDDEWRQDKLKKQLDFMLKSGFLFSYTSYSIKNNGLPDKEINLAKKNYKYPFIIFHNKIATPTVVLHKSLLRENYFPEHVKFGEDQILWIRLSKITKLGNLNKNLANIHHDIHTTTLDFSKKIAAFKSINNYLNNAPLLKVIHRIYIFLRIVLGN